jgi:hypothetical protein
MRAPISILLQNEREIAAFSEFALEAERSAEQVRELSAQM